MGLFDRSRKRIIVDAIFGKLEFHSPDRWYASIFFTPEETDVDLAILGTEDGPYESAKNDWPKIPGRYVALKSQIASVLKELYEQHMSVLQEDEISANFRRAEQAHEVWNIFSLINIGMNSSNEFELLYCFTQSDDDTTFLVSINGERVTGEILGD